MLELTALPSINRDVWLPSIQNADALLVWGGDPLYLAYWFEQSGLGEVLTPLDKDLLYVGVSAGSMVTSAVIGETTSGRRGGSGVPLTSEKITFKIPDGEISPATATIFSNAAASVLACGPLTGSPLKGGAHLWQRK